MKKGEKMSDELKHKISLGNRGKIISIEMRKRISETLKVTSSLIGKPAWNKGKRMSDETRRKMRMSRLGYKMSLASRRKLSLKRMGCNSPNWKGGISKITDIFRHSFEYRSWRQAIFERDDYTCIFCGIRGGKLNADHIKPFAHYPHLRLELSNGRTLCLDCHRKTDTYGFKGIGKNFNDPLARTEEIR